MNTGKIEPKGAGYDSTLYTRHELLGILRRSTSTSARTVALHMAAKAVCCSLNLVMGKACL